MKKKRGKKRKNIIKKKKAKKAKNRKKIIFLKKAKKSALFLSKNKRKKSAKVKPKKSALPLVSKRKKPKKKLKSALKLKNKISLKKDFSFEKESDIRKKVNLSFKNQKENIESSFGAVSADIKQGEAIHKTKIRIIGIGGGGGAIVSEIASRIKKADFIIANTDSRSVADPSKKVKKFQFGANITKGLGTGMNPELGEAAANDEKERIKKVVEGQDLCIIIACLGGGTSCGATPVFSKISKDFGNLTYGIFTLPFEFEGRKKMEAALASLEKIKPNLNIFTVIPNERIFEIIDKNTPLKTALSTINKRLADNLEGLIEMIYLPGMVNIDFADLKTILAGRGRLSYLNSVIIEEPEKDESINRLISSRIYPYALKGAKGILYNISSGKDIQLAEVARISNIINEVASKDAKIIFGINQNQKNQSKTRITLLATGCSAKGFLENSRPLISEIKHSEYKSSPTITSEYKSNPSATDDAIKRDISFGLEPDKIASLSASAPIKTAANKKTIKDKPVINKEKIIKKKTAASIFKKEKPKKISVKGKSKLELKTIQPALNPIPVKKINVSPNASLATRIAVQSLENGKVRKNALQVRKEAEEAENEILEQEKVWEIPAILRNKNKQI